MQKTYCYIGGKIILSENVFVRADDVGLLRGYAIYEGITTRYKKPFYLSDHLDRFRKSANELHLKIPLTNEKIRKIIESLVKKNGFERTNLRMILSGGKTIGGIDYDSLKSTFFILVEEWKPLPKHLYQKGGKLITEEYIRFMPQVKTTNYINAVRLQSKRKKEKAIEILYKSTGKILECSTSNIFMFKNNILITPKHNVLLGITRQVVLDIAKKHFKIQERNILITELAKADEVFITSSYKDILPIVKVDNMTVGSGVVGKNTRSLIKLFSFPVYSG